MDRWTGQVPESSARACVSCPSPGRAVPQRAHSPHLPGGGSHVSHLLFLSAAASGHRLVVGPWTLGAPVTLSVI